MPQTTTVSVRMYNMGFGDAFLVTVCRDHQVWRMLVDCGVHSQGQARPINEAVDAIIADLAAASVDGRPHLDVIIATHHHADHIVGFSLPAWEQVTVDEVWVPFVEDEADPDTTALRRAQTETANQLLRLIESRKQQMSSGALPLAVSMAEAFAWNSFGNADATDRLLGRNGQRFAAEHRVRFLPEKDPARNVIDTSISSVVVHVLGPSRDPEVLKRMDPPANAGWLRLDSEPVIDDEDMSQLFNPNYVVNDDSRLHPDLLKDKKSLNLSKVNNDPGILGAAAILERAVNNTSVFFVLDVAGTRLLFPGDAQQGTWDHVLGDAEKTNLVRDVVFYKIGHHGSHNATPKRFVETILKDGGYAMLPWGLVRRWRDTIPKAALLQALEAHHHRVIRADAPQPEPGKVTVHEDLWTEVTFTAT